ncbi:MAG: AAA family ATPase [Gammaproteobacteria bacterium]|nr:AAA family ATPase [Gammaproteobacteria bacterium]MBP6051043.1 AAA family ATPase [Pseudomonadales bacterium]MBK7169693.1 AAA family ATPase [Gammaproteobacteria bacterium]MBK7521184.1 AAA family ATPase [Gammaproteobacteria bacterium]MBK7728959.1 AAA family ATPase [Gammaproteobacteria bacterium]
MQEIIEKTVRDIGRVLLGKDRQIRLALCALFSRGHLLIEDLPGMGKTTLSHALARALGLEFTRVQFTSDMLPGDILGVSVFDQRANAFSFHPGPIFTEVLLADEINRTTPKTQSALLEAMAEHQVTVEGQTRELPEEFFVIATQNPVTQAGTFALPESQLDRFLMRIDIGYPDRNAERAMLTGQGRVPGAEALEPSLGREDLRRIQRDAQSVATADMLLDYVQRLTGYTRSAPEFAHGLSPRGALALLASARTWAYMEGRSHVVPEDVQAVLPAVVAHRLRGASEFSGDGRALAERLLTQVDIFG